MKTPPAAIPLAILFAIAASLILAACGGSSPTSTAENEQTREQKAEARFADFARCLREHGVEAEAISHPGGGHGLKIGPGPGSSGASEGPQQMEAAEKACARYRPAPQKVNLSPQERVEREEAVQKFAKCMREHGIKVETSTQGGGVQIRIRAHAGAGAEGGPIPESPAFQTAQKDCSGLLPGGGPKGAPGSGSRQAKGAGGSESQGALFSGAGG
jgi:hypothetical protein